MTGTRSAVLAVAIVMIAGCGVSTRTTFPPLGSTPAPAGDRTDAVEREVIAALAELGLQAVDALRSYRPPEGPLLAAAPRTILQATLPDDPSHGFIVIYSFDSAPDAQKAAEDDAAYIASGVGRVQFAASSRFVLRIVGSTVVFFTWSPDTATDPRTRSIEDALLRIGSGVTVPS